MARCRWFEEDLGSEVVFWFDVDHAHDQVHGVLSSTVVELVLRQPWYRQNASFDSIDWSLSVLHAAQTSVLLSMPLPS